jgi:membrane protein implicated in regulation of membrane protease activity
MTIAAGVLLAAFLSFEGQLGVSLVYFGIPLQVVFFLLYIVGSILIFFGARQFTRRPSQKEKVTV